MFSALFFKLKKHCFDKTKKVNKRFHSNIPQNCQFITSYLRTVEYFAWVSSSKKSVRFCKFTSNK